METKDVITLIIAAYGAVLSTVMFFVRRRDNKPKIKVSLDSAYLVEQNYFGENPVLDMIQITATNTGKVDVVIDQLGFEFKNMENMVFIGSLSSSDGSLFGDVLPKRLKPGEKVERRAETKNVISEFDKMNRYKHKAYARSSLGKFYFSKKTNFKAN